MRDLPSDFDDDDDDGGGDDYYYCIDDVDSI